MNAPSIVYHLARVLGDGDPGNKPEAERAAALACQATQDGHICADLDCATGWGPWASALDEAQRAAFRARLPSLKIVGSADDWTPLVWDGRRLYLRRYWDYERAIAADLASRAVAVAVPDDALEARLAVLFADTGQRQAARVALSRRLCLVSGGPGTGKTHTLARMIGLLQERMPDLRITLAAPTGKAAARMGEALQDAGVTVAEEAQTLHRLLGMRADGSGFYRNSQRPLAVDVLVVDEASMIDLSLMAHLLAALPPTARLILLGDRDQLAAVEAGAVFADLCASARLEECVATLTTSFRFGAASGIGRLADALRTGDADAALECLGAGAADLAWQGSGEVRAVTAAARAGYAPYRAAVAAGAAPGELFEHFRRFRVLCALRGDVAAVNRALGDALAAGLPVMVVRNDPLLRLFNGDIGLALPDPADGQLKVCFDNEAREGSGFRWIPAVRLPAWEPAWAMTVHKSQGSEFDTVLLALPSAEARVISRELVYTGVTRARSAFALHADATTLHAAVARRTERMSGLRDRLE